MSNIKIIGKGDEIILKNVFKNHVTLELITSDILAEGRKNLKIQKYTNLGQITNYDKYNYITLNKFSKEPCPFAILLKTNNPFSSSNENLIFDVLYKNEIDKEKTIKDNNELFINYNVIINKRKKILKYYEKNKINILKNNKEKIENLYLKQSSLNINSINSLEKLTKLKEKNIYLPVKHKFGSLKKDFEKIIEEIENFSKLINYKE